MMVVADKIAIETDTPESTFRAKYGFTPTKEQIEVLKDDDCAKVFNELIRQPSKSELQEQFDWTKKRVDRAIRRLKGGDLIEGKGEYWQWNTALEEIEEVRIRLFEAIDQPMMVNEWMEQFQTDWNTYQISAAIALLAQEGLIQYDQDTGTYQRITPESDPKSVTLGDIRIDGGTQPRTELNEAVVAEYAELITQGAQFPAITVYFDGVSYWLADGFHRYWAAQRAKAELDIEVIHGSQRDAILHSVGANANHGLRRSNEDKRKAVVTLLQDEEWCQWSDRAIARQCQVSNQFVSNMRKELSVNDGQMGKNHTRKVKRGDQVYEQRQRQASATEPKSIPRQRSSVIPKVRSDINHVICQFLGVEQPSPQEWQSVVYLIPEDLDLEFDRLFQKLKGGKIESAIAVTENQAGPQQDVKDWANAVCLVSDSQSFCSRLVWYFGQERDRFLSLFSEYGSAFLLSKEEDE